MLSNTLIVEIAVILAGGVLQVFSKTNSAAGN